MTTLYVTGEHIHAEQSVVCSLIDGKAYAAGPVAGTYIGTAAEELREGFRVCVRHGDVYEDNG